MTALRYVYAPTFNRVDIFIFIKHKDFFLLCHQLHIVYITRALITGGQRGDRVQQAFGTTRAT